jgi:hypothetical protein
MELFQGKISKWPINIEKNAHCAPIRIANIKITTNNKCGKDARIKEPSYTAGGNVS